MFVSVFCPSLFWPGLLRLGLMSVMSQIRPVIGVPVSPFPFCCHVCWLSIQLGLRAFVPGHVYIYLCVCVAVSLRPVFCVSIRSADVCESEHGAICVSVCLADFVCVCVCVFGYVLCVVAGMPCLWCVSDVDLKL